MSKQKRIKLIDTPTLCEFKDLYELAWNRYLAKKQALEQTEKILEKISKSKKRYR